MNRELLPVVALIDNKASRIMMIFKSRRQFYRLLAILPLVALIAACGVDDEPGRPSGPPGGFGGPGGPPGGFGGRGGGGGPQIPSVEVVQAELGALPLEERLTGRVIARNETEIYPEVSGPIVEIYVDNGDYVREGDPLVQIRDTQYIERYQQANSQLEVARAQRRQAEANLDFLRNQLRRIEELTQRQLETTATLESFRSQVAVAEADLDLRQAQENQARSQLEERRLELANTTVTAPVSGRVGQRNAERGQIVNTNTRLFLVGDLEQVRIEISLTERMLNYINEGMAVNIYSEYWPSIILQSEISRISPFLDSSTLRTQAYVDMENPNNLMRSGTFVTVDVLYGESEQAVLVPNNVIYRNPRTGIEGIYVVDTSGVDLHQQVDSLEGGPQLSQPLPFSFVPVRVVAGGRMVSGVEGINAGDWVVSVGQNLLTGNVSETRVRPMAWERMLQLQRMQSRDLFQIIDQSRQARTEG